MLGCSFGKYRYAVQHDLALFGFSPSEKLPAVCVQPTSLAIHSLGPATLVEWVRDFLDLIGANVTLTVARLDLHSDWQGFWIEADERRATPSGRTRTSERSTRCPTSCPV